ncbi:MAG: DNA-binding protein [Francisellaceae bacterium]
MARPGLSYEDVVAAIEKLLDNREKPSINRIREVIGSGSPTTISRYLKEWRTKAMQSNKEDTESNKMHTLIPETPMQMQRPQQPAPAPARPSIDVSGIADPMVKALVQSSSQQSQEILADMSEEWNIVLNESNTETKVRKLYSALLKEQTRRETAEKMALDARNYADVIKDQCSQRISDLRDNLEAHIAFLNGQIRQLKRESETDLEYYRAQLVKANEALAKLKR